MTSDAKSDSGNSSPSTRAYLVVALSQFLVASDFSYTAIALASIQKDLNVDPATLQWIVSAWALTFGGAVIFGGRLADIAGYRFCYTVGMICFGVGTLMVGTTPSIEIAIVGRAFIGLGGALTKPAVLAYISQISASKDARIKILTAYYMWNGLGAGIGIVLGGLLINILGWRSLFLVNVALVAAAMVAGYYAFQKEVSKKTASSLDLPGALLATAMTTLLIFTLSSIAKTGWHSPRALATGIATIFAAIAFVVVESKTANPAVPLSIFRLPNFAGAMGCAICASASNSAMLVLLPLYLQQVTHYTPLQASLTSLPMILSVFLFGKYYIPKIMRGRHPGFGIQIGFVTLFALALLLSALQPYWVPLIPLVFASFNNFGYFMVQMSATAEATAHASAESRGVTSGVYIAALDFSPALGVALTAIGLQPATLGETENFPAAFLIAAGITVTGFLINRLAIRRDTTT